MESQLSAYLQRLKRVNNTLVEIGELLKSKGFDVVYQRTNKGASFECIRFIAVRKSADSQWVSLGFTEVPYRWYMHGNHKPNRETGSSYSLGDMDYHSSQTAEDIVTFYQKELDKHREIGGYDYLKNYGMIYQEDTPKKF